MPRIRKYIPPVIGLLEHCSSGDLKKVKILLDNGDDVNQVFLENTPLNCAAAKGHLEVVRLLLGRGAEVDKIPVCDPFFIRDKKTALYFAAENGHLDVVRLLLDHGAVVDKANRVGITPLYVASENGHVAVVHALLDRGAVVDKAHEYGITPLYIAAEFGHVDVAHALLDRGADVEKTITLARSKGVDKVERFLSEILEERPRWSDPRKAWCIAVARGIRKKHDMPIVSESDSEISAAVPVVPAVATGHSTVAPVAPALSRGWCC
jgi:hypothetical protein